MSNRNTLAREGNDIDLKEAEYERSKILATNIPMFKHLNTSLFCKKLGTLLIQ